MDFRSWINNLFKPKDKQPSTLINAPAWAGNYTPKFTSFGNDIYYSDLVLAAIRLKATFCGKLDPRHIRTDASGKPATISDSIQKILKTPNNYSTAYEFLSKACFLREVNNNVFIYPDYVKTNGTKTYTSMHILQPTSWQYLEDDASGDLFIKFTFRDRSEPVIFPYGEIIHWKKNYEQDTYDGGGLYTANGDKELLSFLSSYHSLCESIAEASKCSCYFDGILKVNAFGQDLEAIQKIRDKFVDDLTKNTSKVAVLDNGAEWQSIQRNLKLVDAATLQFFEQHILIGCGGVSLAMLKGDYTQAQKDAFYDAIIEPAAISLGQAMSKVFFTQWQASHGDEVILYVSKLDRLSVTEANAVVAATGAMGVWTKDDIRGMYGAAPLPNGEGQTIPRGYNNLDGGEDPAPATETENNTGDLTE